MVIQCSCTVTKALVPSEISISTVLPGRYLKLQTYDADTMQIGLESMWCICYFYDSMILISSLVCLVPYHYIVYSRYFIVLLLLSFYNISQELEINVLIQQHLLTCLIIIVNKNVISKHYFSVFYCKIQGIKME